MTPKRRTQPEQSAKYAGVPSQRALDIETNAMLAAGERVARSVAAIIHGNGKSIFSGSFVRSGSQYLVLTARHCIEAVMDWNDIRILSFNRPEVSRPAATRGRFWVTSPHDVPGADLPRLDIGFILLHESLAQSLNAEWIPIERIGSGRVKGGDGVFLTGFPAQLASVIRGQRGERATALHPLHFVGEVARHMPQGLARQARRHIDMFVHFEHDDLVKVGTGASIDPIAPAGMSGCGVFSVQRVRKRGLWTAGSMDLVGIQSSFLPDRRLLRATRAAHARHALTLLSQVTQQRKE